MFDYFQKHAFERACQPGSEERVDDDVVSPARFRDLLPAADSFTFDEGQRCGRFRRTGFEAGESSDGFEVGVGVAGCFRELAKQNDVALDARAAESAGECGAVAAVVAFAAEYEGAFAG